MKFNNKNLKQIIKKKSLPYTFEYISALRCSSGKKKDLMSHLTVIAVSEESAICSEQGNERVYSLNAEFRIKK